MATISIVAMVVKDGGREHDMLCVGDILEREKSCGAGVVSPGLEAWPALMPATVRKGGCLSSRETDTIEL